VISNKDHIDQHSTRD